MAERGDISIRRRAQPLITPAQTYQSLTKVATGAYPSVAFSLYELAPLFNIETTEAVRENVVRLGFTEKVFFSGLLDAFDASDPKKYLVSVVAGTRGFEGSTVRPVNATLIALPGENEGTALEDIGKFVDVWFDRSMTPFPAKYSIRARMIWNEDKDDYISETTREFFAIRRHIVASTTEFNSRAADFAVATSSVSSVLFGGFAYGENGDYASTPEEQSRVERYKRRLFTKKNGFAHLPGYGVGVLQYGKKLANAATRNLLIAEAEQQLRLEPDILNVQVSLTNINNKPNLFLLRVLAKTKTGGTVRFQQSFFSPIG